MSGSGWLVVGGGWCRGKCGFILCLSRGSGVNENTSSFTLDDVSFEKHYTNKIHFLKFEHKLAELCKTDINFGEVFTPFLKFLTCSE